MTATNAPESATPRVDVLVERNKPENNLTAHNDMLDLARTLERELAALRKQPTGRCSAILNRSRVDKPNIACQKYIGHDGEHYHEEPEGKTLTSDRWPNSEQEESRSLRDEHWHTIAVENPPAWTEGMPEEPPYWEGDAPWKAYADALRAHCEELAGERQQWRDRAYYLHGNLNTAERQLAEAVANLTHENSRLAALSRWIPGGENCPDVWIVESGDYEQRCVNHVASSIESAAAMVKLPYVAPYIVTWDAPRKDDDDTHTLIGHFTAVDGYCGKGQAEWTFTRYKIDATLKALPPQEKS